MMVWFAIGLIMLGCCSNVIVLELMLNIDSQCGSLVTIAQFLFITVTSLRDNLEQKQQQTRDSDGDDNNSHGGGGLLFGGWRLRRRTIPLHFHLLIVILFFGQSIINNLAFGFHISMPLHSIFRSGSLIMNLLIGVLFFGMRVPWSKIMCVIAITLGILCATFASSQNVKENKENVYNQQVEYSTWILGVALLFLSQVFSGLLGNMQEYSYGRWGKDWRENIFYSHLLSLPFFVLFSSGLYATIVKFNAQPIAWLYMVLNILTQFMCIRGVYLMTSLSGTLAATLTITVRKFVSLVISVIWFGSHARLGHYLAAILVFGGSCAFALIKDEPTVDQTSTKSTGLEHAGEADKKKKE